MITNAIKIDFFNENSVPKHTGGTVCYGHFSVLHPGHFRYLEYAASRGVGLSVVIKGDRFLDENEKVEGFTENDRAQNLAALSYVDHVIVQSDISISELMIKIKPEVLVLGKDFDQNTPDVILEAIKATKSVNGEVQYHAGTAQNSATSLHSDPLENEKNKRLQSFRNACKRQGVLGSKLHAHTTKFSQVNLIVIGDTILDNYVACDALGLSAEAPVVVLRELGQRAFIGGAAVVAAHVKAMGAQCTFISVIGDDAEGEEISSELKDSGVKQNLIIDKTRPTTFKTRFMVEKQKLFRVSRLEEHDVANEIENLIIEQLESAAPDANGILVSDFVYGVITPRVLEKIQQLAQKFDLLLFGDLQCSSQFGNVTKFNNFSLITPTEKEARISLNDKDSGLEALANTLLEEASPAAMLLKLGPSGFICYAVDQDGSIRREHFPALSSNPLDVSGAGDSLIASMAVTLCSGAGIFDAAAIGTIVSEIAVDTLGNIPVSIDTVQRKIREITHG